MRARADARCVYAQARKGPYGIRRCARDGRNQQRASGTSRATMDARNLLRQFKNIGNYLRLLFDPDVYGLCKLYVVMGCLTVASSYISPSPRKLIFLLGGELKILPRYRYKFDLCVQTSQRSIAVYRPLIG